MKQEETKGFGIAVKYMFKKSASLFKQMWVTVISLFSGKIRLSQLSGPVGIYTIVADTASVFGVCRKSKSTPSIFTVCSSSVSS